MVLSFVYNAFSNKIKGSECLFPFSKNLSEYNEKIDSKRRVIEGASHYFHHKTALDDDITDDDEDGDDDEMKK